MRKIENKEIDIQFEMYQQDASTNKIILVKKEAKSDYFTQFVSFLKQPPKDGWNSSTNFDRLRIRMVLLPLLEDKKVGEQLTIEEKQWDEILKCYKEWNWSITTMSIIDLDDYITKGVEEIKA